jgi:hypothetical protein
VIFFVAGYMAGATAEDPEGAMPDELTHDSQQCGTVTTCLVVSKLVDQTVTSSARSFKSRSWRCLREGHAHRWRFGRGVWAWLIYVEVYVV